MKIPKNYTQIKRGLVREGDYIKWNDSDDIELAHGLIGGEIYRGRSFTVYRKKRNILDKAVSPLKKENAALKAELADIKAKWTKVEERLSALLDVM